MCIRDRYKHGRTYFAAATLMNPQRFFDTAAMYGLFRVTDDIVDNLGSSAERQRNLDEFMAKFWENKKSGIGLASDHAILPAVVHTINRVGAYTDEQFHLFFKSMIMDVDDTVCATIEDTVDYMEGSAAVMGDFMVPILMAHDTPDKVAAAIPHARDLGRAFQMTNFLRDIGEDLTLSRQYVPQDICDKFGVTLSKRDSSTPEFKAMMEHLFDFTDKYYASAEKGILMLPTEVQDVIHVASIVYHDIHEQIRKSNYAVFAPERIRVSFWKKLGIARQHISLWKALRVTTIELFFLAIYYLLRYRLVWIPLAAAVFYALRM
eukprot:TRINITY_DN9184_c0_g1_i3.p1 TRINITY_DN9184_c0_g1~~TRINITY_DN9184_c0_g1_i3.p1  ORF type:complete len:320 (-),score=85.28 TRINITY_DN9184_c0_g1_i3:204-1163(-)